MKMRVFFPYFGAKFMRAPKYPAPRCEHIIEPFAGAAGYSIRHNAREVTLIDASHYVAGVWDFLIRATERDILSLPIMSPGDDVVDLPIHQEAKWLLGFWVNQGSSVPKRTMGGRASNRKFGTWGVEPRARLAGQVGQIKHWKITHGDYREAPDVDATWFIDPPYQTQGKQYPSQIDDFNALADWCKSRAGQVMVCEAADATWLPFEPVTTVAGSSHRISTEMLWENQSQQGRPE